MEVGTGSSPSSAGSGGGGGDREEAARGRGGGAMRARVCARVRTPQGVGLLLLVGGAIVGAAVVAWRRRGDRKNAKNHLRDKEEAKVLDGGAVENEQGKFDNSDESLSRENTEVEANGLDVEKTEELHEIQAKVDEIVADELESVPADKFDQSSSRECTKIIDDTGRGDRKISGQNSVKDGVEDEITPNATDVENSDESTLTTISSPEIAHKEHKRCDHGSDQETTSTQVIAVTQMTAHQPQMSDTLKADNITKTVTLNNVAKHEEQISQTQDPVTPVISPPCSSLPSLLRTTQKKIPVNPTQNETWMKLGQDWDNGEQSKGGAAQGVAMVTMNRRAASMAILAIIFALTIGVNVVVRFYSTLRAT